MNRNKKVGRRTFESDERAYRLFLSKLAERPGFDESFCNYALEFAYKETYRVTKPLKQYTKQRLLGFLPRYREKIQEDLELLRTNPKANIKAPGSAKTIVEDSHSSGEESVESSHNQEERRRTFFTRCELNEDCTVEKKKFSKSMGSHDVKRRQTLFCRPTVAFQNSPETYDAIDQSDTHEGIVRSEADSSLRLDVRGDILENNETNHPTNVNGEPEPIIKEEAIDVSELHDQNDVIYMEGHCRDPLVPANKESPVVVNYVNNNNKNIRRKRAKSSGSYVTAVDSCYCNTSKPINIIINTGPTSAPARPSLSVPSSSNSKGQESGVPLQYYGKSSGNQQAWIQINIDRLGHEIESTKERLNFLNSQLVYFQNLIKNKSSHRPKRSSVHPSNSRTNESNYSTNLHSQPMSEPSSSNSNGEANSNLSDEEVQKTPLHQLIAKIPFHLNCSNEPDTSSILDSSDDFDISHI